MALRGARAASGVTFDAARATSKSPVASVRLDGVARRQNLRNPDLRLPDERARLRAPGGPHGRRRPGAAPTTTHEADVVIFNTCTIRENADLKLYSALGHLRRSKEQRPGHADRRRGLHGPEGPRRDPRAAPAGSTWSLARTTSPRRRRCCEAHAARVRIVEILDAPDPEASRDMAPALYAVRELPFAAWMTIQTGCDNTCAYCIVPSVRGEEISRPFDDLVARGAHARRSRASARSRCSDRTSTPTDATSPGAARSSRELLRALGEVDGIERIRFTSPHPKDLRPETIAAMAETAAVCPQLHLPLQSGSNRVLQRHAPRLHAPSATSSGSRSARAAIDDLAVTTDLIVGFPGETDAEFDETLDVVAEARVRLGLHLHLLAARGHPGRGDGRDEFVARRRRSRSASSD